MIKTTAGFLAALLLTYVAGAIFISQGNLAQVVALGLNVDFGTRIEAAIHDVTNMTALYLPIVGLTLLIAFAVARLVIGFLPNLRLIGYTLAGFVGMVAVHLIIEAVVGQSGIATTRFVSGLLMQGVAGAIGGFGFYLVTRPSGTPA